MIMIISVTRYATPYDMHMCRAGPLGFASHLSISRTAGLLMTSSCCNFARLAAGWIGKERILAHELAVSRKWHLGQ
jgi:hypothetical protein